MEPLYKRSELQQVSIQISKHLSSAICCLQLPRLSTRAMPALLVCCCMLLTCES